MTQLLKNPLFQDNIALDIVALLAGALLPFAFAPYNMYLLAIICPAMLLGTWLSATPYRALVRGLLFGLTFFGIAIYWVFISIHTFGNTPAIIAFIITAGFVVLLSCCIGLHAFVFRWLFPTANGLNLTIGFAASWVIIEWLRGWLFTGFPWIFIGYSQIDTALAGFAPIISVYGVSFLAVLSSGLLVNALRNKKAASYSLPIIALIWLTGWGLCHINWTHPDSKAQNVSIIQGNIEQSVKWDPNRTPAVLTRYYDLTLQNIYSDIILWPEAAIPMWPSQASDFIQHLNVQLNQAHTALLTGIPLVNEQQTAIYNGAIALGNGNGQYAKRHLVPFGEYVPLENWLRGVIGFFNLPMSNLSPGPSQQPLIMLAGIPTTVSICYEIAYDAEFLSNFPGAKFIVTISDDAWFGDSWAALQQTQISQMRSLETGRYQAVATNNGFSVIIGPKGELLNTLPRFQTGVLHGKIYAVDGNTPLNWMGIMPIIIIVFLLFFVAILLNKRI